MPILRRSGGSVSPGRDTTAPSRPMLPLATGSNPAMARNKLVLPQPLGPSRQPMAPSASDRETSEITGGPP